MKAITGKMTLLGVDGKVLYEGTGTLVYCLHSPPWEGRSPVHHTIETGIQRAIDPDTWFPDWLSFPE